MMGGAGATAPFDVIRSLRGAHLFYAAGLLLGTCKFYFPLSLKFTTVSAVATA